MLQVTYRPTSTNVFAEKLTPKTNSFSEKESICSPKSNECNGSRVIFFSYCRCFAAVCEPQTRYLVQTPLRHWHLAQGPLCSIFFPCVFVPVFVAFYRITVSLSCLSRGMLLMLPMSLVILRQVTSGATTKIAWPTRISAKLVFDFATQHYAQFLFHYTHKSGVSRKNDLER